MFNSVILKLTAFCNLDCTYCFMFNMDDRTFERVPRNMQLSTALATLDRIEEYLDENPGQPFRVILHGGEPSIWPAHDLEHFLERFWTMKRRQPGAEIGMQTNGYHLKPEVLDLLSRFRVGTSFSLDGPEYVNDRYRVNHSGAGSYRKVMENLERFATDPATRDLFGGVLCVAQPEIEPRSFIDWARNLPSTRLDVLWPIEFNYDNPPWKNHTSIEEYARNPTYGAWFAELFDLWWQLDDPSFHIRQFYDLVALHCGGWKHTDQIVNNESNIFAVNTDGRIEYPDYLRGSSDGGTDTGLNIIDTSLKAVEEDPGFQFLFDLGSHCPSECSDCAVRDLCGGGFLSGRLEQDAVFPGGRSVLCFDHYFFLKRVRDRVIPAMQTHAA